MGKIKNSQSDAREFCHVLIEIVHDVGHIKILSAYNLAFI